MAQYDVIVIGGGPGGYVAAIRGAQLGLKVACVEGRGTLGGTCLNVGCIPSKALLHSSHLYHETLHNFAEMGLIGKSPTVDWGKMLEYKQGVVDSNTKGIEFLFKKNKVDYIQGWGRIEAVGKVSVDGTIHEAKNIIIATGSEPATLPNVEIDEKIVVSSTGALDATKIPKKLVVIGAGVIGLELGSVFARLGSEVTVIEFLDNITPGMDGEVQKTFQRILTKQGMNFILGSAVQKVEASKTKAKVTYQNRKSGEESTLEGDMVLVATGRRPYTAGLGLDAMGVEMTERGFVKRNAKWETNIAGIYAIGDVTEGPMLAHKAEDEGIAAIETIAGKHGHVNYGLIPGVIYTTPEVATIGLTEEQLKSQGREYKVGKFPFLGNGRAKSVLETDGFVKILADKNTDRILGCHIIGPSAGEIIHEVVVAMEFGAAAEDIARTCHAHPTFSEAIRESALALGDGAIHV